MNALAEEFGVDRRTVKKRLADTRPDGEQSGHPAWYLVSAAPMLVASVVSIADANDPDKLLPKDRLDYYKAEREKLKFEEEIGELIPVEQVRIETAGILKTIVSSIACLPDELERICLLDGKGVQRVQDVVDNVRNQISAQLIDLVTDEELDDVRICDCDKAGCH